MVDQFKIEGVKVIENKIHLVQSLWEEGKQPAAPNLDYFLDLFAIHQMQNLFFHTH